MIPFNKPFLTGNEVVYIQQAVASGKISGNGMFTQKVQTFFEKRYGVKKVLLTTSCTDALEMAAILTNIQPGDEVIVPSYTFVSSALAFVRQGARIVFADSCCNNPNLDANKLEALVTSRTKVIVPVHYAGVACDMDAIMKIAEQHHLFVVEDAAQSIDSYYRDRPLGSIGHFGCFSFHETKNIISGEGGMLMINDEAFVKRAEVIWEKGTNRAEYFRGEVNKYSWVDTGSSFLPSDVIAAFLYAQIENLDLIQKKRLDIWHFYWEQLSSLSMKGYFKLPILPTYATNNAHMFYLVCNSLKERSDLIDFLKAKGVLAVFHYLSLHKSSFYSSLIGDVVLEESDRYTDTLVRLPLFYELTVKEAQYVVDCIVEFYDL